MAQNKTHRHTDTHTLPPKKKFKRRMKRDILWRKDGSLFGTSYVSETGVIVFLNFFLKNSIFKNFKILNLKIF